MLFLNKYNIYLIALTKIWRCTFAIDTVHRANWLAFYLCGFHVHHSIAWITYTSIGRDTFTMSTTTQRAKWHTFVLHSSVPEN